MTGSLLTGADLSCSPEEEEEDACPPLLPGPPRPQRLQSTLQSINLRVKQVDLLSELLVLGGLTVCLTIGPISPGGAAGGVWKCGQWKNLADVSYIGTGD